MSDKNNEFDEFEESFESVTVQDEFGNDLDFYIIDGAEYKGVQYLLVVESEFIDDDECEATILKEIPSEDGEESIFVLVEDDAEFDAIAAILETNSDDYDLEVE